MPVVDEILRIFLERGHGSYFGEPVSQLEHALQCAQWAREEHVSDTLIAAALLHDFGHLVHDEAEHIAEQGIDMRHEDLGDTWLSRHFDEAVTAPVRMHVAAKRYLCATEPAYYDALSPASKQSLALQGGPMSESEQTAFASDPFYSDALRLRRWDDRAKILGYCTAPLNSYRELLERLAHSDS